MRHSPIPPILPGLALAALLPFAAAAEEGSRLTGRLLQVVSHSSCEGEGALPSFVVVEDAGLEVAYADLDAPRLRRPARRITVRRGSEVSEERIGFNRATPEPEAAPEPQTMRVTLALEGLLCQTRTASRFTAGTWSLTGETGDIALALDGRLPSEEMMLQGVRFDAEGVAIDIALELQGELMAEDTRRLRVTAEPRILIADTGS